MNLNKIKGNTYYIDSAINVGVFIFKNKNCLIIDTGSNNSDAKKIDELISENNLHPKYIINTHSHLDHCGGNNYFKKNYPGCLVYSSSKEKMFMENQEIHASILSCSSPMKGIEKSTKSIIVDLTLDYGINKINDEKFDIISLKGHSIEQIGVITPERVCFLGDSIFSENILEKYSLPYLFDLEESLNTLAKIKEIDADFFVIGHAENILNKDEIITLVGKNLHNIENYNKQILDLLDQPLTREEILENLTVLNELDYNFYQYHLSYSSVCAFISYLFTKGFIDYSLEYGKLYYFKKSQ
ncbi:MBL fold metallo-hydrolase [Clostridium sp. DJ247]|uniref:MBL fold metallo-hydrolase n=1 Tax=Clostridium sp. DJ247 TaxID=2726188 RepID=UPI001628C610|nr:MBL fold metallo-hydrolase [Clostridium sp. DJ247]MBC2581586.1 MBL fold metallo-hydrolase [Clostridium sp. DJ247]